MDRRDIAAALIVIVAMAAAGCLRAAAAPAAAPAAPPDAVAASSPSAVPAADVAGSEAFVDGYRAYGRRDLDAAVKQLGYAAGHFPPLADYALFYLGLAERDRGDLPAAMEALERLAARYPESVTVPKAQLELARIYRRMGRADDTAAAARAAIAAAPGTPVEQASRLELARALSLRGDVRAAYNELMALRRKDPRGPQDGAARAFAYSILGAHPGMANAGSAPYRRDEAALLLKEGEPAMALEQARAGLSLLPPPALRAELLFLRARALRSSPAKAETAFKDYLRAAPQGPSAPEALESLALIYWQRDERALSRATLARLIARFPKSRLAPGARLERGRIFEEEKRFAAARAEYAALLARYPHSAAARAARFRAPWTYYMSGRYAPAAKGFGAGRGRAGRSGSEPGRFSYWQARALEKSGGRPAARKIYAALAASIESNYYPALAARRAGIPAPALPAASLPDLRPGPAPDVSGPAAFHVGRVLTLSGLGLKELEPAELERLANRAADHPALGRFVLARFEEAGAYYDAIVAARRMEQRGELGHDAAERVRYPRAYWSLIAPAAAKNSLDPYLVLALMRQESWFNPQATSVSDARGLMQLLPGTARRLAEDGAVRAGPINFHDLYDPALNVELGTAYLAGLLVLFHGDEARAVAAYNAGERAVEGWNARFVGADDEWVENIGYRETRRYVKRVIGGKREYLLLYPPHAASRTRRGALARLVAR